MHQICSHDHTIIDIPLIMHNFWKIKMASSNALTFDFELDSVGGGRVLCILRVAGERARVSATHALQHQRPVGDDHPRRHVVGQLVVLQSHSAEIICAESL